MPIQPTLDLRSVSDEEFAEIDSVVMRCAYATQNHFGRMFDERVYENDLAARLRAEGLSVDTQIPIYLCHDGFEKTYLLDLVVNQMVYELKVVSSLLAEHDAQALNYAMLQNIRLVKLLNFGSPKVIGKLLCNALSCEDRYRLALNLENWTPLGERCSGLIELAKSIVEDFGTHLHSGLYNEALVHSFGGHTNCLSRADLFGSDGLLGSHPVQLHDSNCSFVFTGFTGSREPYCQHLNVLLQHASTLKGIQWINLKHSCLEVFTFERSHSSKLIGQENGGKRMLGLPN